MYLFYIDESGNENDPTDKHFVLGGAAIFERVTHFLSEGFERIQNEHFPGQPPIPFHASHIRAGSGFWRNVNSSVKTQLLQDIAEAIVGEREPSRGLVLFAAAIEKSDKIHGEDAVKLATEYICKRFDTFLMRRYHEHDDPQRGLLIFSKGRYDKRAGLWVKGFRELGTQWGVLRNFVDIPYFASMKDTRLLQAADFVAHATFLLYERQDASLISTILERFDQKDNILHGLVHHVKEPTKRDTCGCPACASRRTPGDFGSWV